MARLTPLDIRKTEFKQSALGYAKEQVTQFLESVADEVEELIRESNELRKENGRLMDKLGSYRNVEQSMNEALVLAKDSAKKTLAAAQKEADAVLQKGMTEKDALLFSAKEELSQLQRDIHTLKLRRDGVLMKLRSVLKNHLESLELEFSDEDLDSGPAPASKLPPDEKVIDFSNTDISFAEIEEEAGSLDDVPEPEDEDEPENEPPTIEGELEDFSVDEEPEEEK